MNSEVSKVRGEVQARLTYRLGNTLDVVTKDLTVTLRTTPVHGNSQNAPRSSAADNDDDIDATSVILTFRVPFHLCHGQTLS